MRNAIVTIFMFVAAVFVTPLSSAIGEPDAALVAMSFNIRYGTASDGDDAWQYRRELCIEVMTSRDADIIGLQEVLAFQLDELREALPKYAVIGVGRDDGLTKGEYAPLLIRTARFAIDQSGTLWLSDTPTEPGSTSWGNTIPRICTWARLIDQKTAEPLWVYNLHLDHQSQASRAMSIELVASRIAARPKPAEPVVVMGDLNAGESNSVVQYAIGNVRSASELAGVAPSPDLTDTFRAVHPDATEVGTFNGFKDKRDGAKIDHLFCSVNMSVLDAGIDRTRGPNARCPSDHEPVWAKLVVNENDDSKP